MNYQLPTTNYSLPTPSSHLPPPTSTEPITRPAPPPASAQSTPRRFRKIQPRQSKPTAAPPAAAGGPVPLLFAVCCLLSAGPRCCVARTPPRGYDPSAFAADSRRGAPRRPPVPSHEL